MSAVVSRAVLKGFYQALLRSMEDDGIGFDVLSGTGSDGAPDFTKTDVDILTTDRAACERILNLATAQARKHRVGLLQVKRNAWGGLLLSVGKGGEALALDLLPGLRRYGRTVPTTEDHVSGRRGDLGAVMRAAELKRRAKAGPELVENASRLKRWLADTRERWGRLVKRVKIALDPATQGVVVAVLGPDGVGKSTTLDAVAHSLEERSLFVVDRFHGRPFGVRLPKAGGHSISPHITPHAVATHGVVKSLLKELYILADYTVGYLVRVSPRAAMGHIVLFDRHYYDMWGDLRRYRLKRLSAVSRLGRHMVQPPDLTIVLAAPPNVVRERKQEVDADTTVAQLRRYDQIPRRLGVSNAHVVRTDRPRDTVVQDVLALIFKTMAAKSAVERPPWR